MKKIFILTTLTILSLSTLTSCSDDENGGSKKGSSLSAVAGAVQAAIFDADNPSVQASNFVSKMLTFIEDPNADKPDDVPPMEKLSVSGEDEVLGVVHDDLVATGSKGNAVTFEEAISAVADMISGSDISKAPAKGEGKVAVAKFPFKFITGKYTYNPTDKSYTIDKIIRVKFLTGKTMQIVYNGKEFYYDGTLSQGSLAAGDNTDYLCRAWTVDKVVIAVKGSTTYGKEFKTNNLVSIADDLTNHNVNISESDYNDIKNIGAFKKIVFATSGEITIYFTNKIYTGKISNWNVGKGTFKYEFIDKENMDNPIVNASGTAKVKFDSSSNVLTFDSKYTNKSNQSYTISSQLYLTPVNK